MKPFYVVVLMGAAAIGGGLAVRYGDHPVEITLARPTPPTVLAPPVAPIEHVEHVGRPSPAPPRPAPPAEKAPPQKAAIDKPVKPDRSIKVEKPSVFGKPVIAPPPAKPAERPAPDPPRAVARVRIPPEPPAIVEIAHNTEGPPPAPAPVPVAKPTLPPPPLPPEANHATLKAGMLITVRIGEALSSNLNSSGDVFSGTLEKPLIADGFVIAERGARVRGEVVESKSASSGQISELAIRLREVASSDGQRIHLVSATWKKQGAASAVPTGSIYDVALTRDGAAVIRPATSITFRLDETVELTEKQH